MRLKKDIKPPKWMLSLMKFFIKKDYIEEVEGDMEEIFQNNLAELGAGKARRRYAVEVLKLIRPVLLKNVSSIFQIGNLGVLQNTIKSIVRSSLKHKMFATINVTGLAIGIASAFFMFEYVRHESTYENFHENANNIYRITSEYGNNSGFNVHWARTHQDWIDDLIVEIPEVKAQIRFQNFNPRVISVDGQSFKEKHAFSVDANVFEVFTLPFLLGEKQGALTEPFSAVLTEALSLKYFGTENPLGKTIQILNDGDSVLENYKVTGVIKDIPSNTHLPISMLTSFRSPEERRGWAYNYLQLFDDVEKAAVENKISKLTENYIQQQEGSYNNFHLWSFKDIHLYSNLAREIIPNGNVFYLRLFGIAGLFVLAMAMINFVNLTVIKSMERAKETGVRKALGSSNKSIFQYFITESIFYSALSTACAFFLVLIFRKHFTLMSGIDIAFQSSHAMIVISLILIVGVLSGIYPAILMLRIEPIHALKGTRTAGNKSRDMTMRKVLLSIQFIMFLLILSSMMLSKGQFNFLKTKKLGFDHEQILAITNSPLSAQSQYERFKYEVESLPGISEVSANMQVPFDEIRDSGSAYFEGLNEDSDVVVDIQVADTNYIEFMGLNMIAGRNFSQSLRAQSRPPDTASMETFINHLTSARREYIINETTMKLLGESDPANIIGKQFACLGPVKLQRGPIVGVVEDYHQETLRNKIDPIAMVYEPVWLRTFLVKLETGNINQTLATIDHTWAELFPNYPMEAVFLDDLFNDLYETEQRQKELLSVFSALVVIIALLGLLGLISFVLQKRMKELAIRKILGASFISNTLMLGRTFIVLSFVAFCIAIPVAFYFMKDWLDGFAYHISISGFEFAIAFLALLFVISLTIIFQLKKFDHINPAEILRQE